MAYLILNPICDQLRPVCLPYPFDLLTPEHLMGRGEEWQGKASEFVTHCRIHDDSYPE
ncbi:hypothetical protein J6590_011660 [Homalodisca vitripennis]|nr:hypothetical protein J6590_011660 [Homalodisca vitripennis]